MKLLKIVAFIALFTLSPLIQAQTWVIFVHGTIGGALALYHMNEIKKDSIADGSAYARQVERYRKKELNSKDHLLLDYGLIGIPPAVTDEFLQQQLNPLMPEYGAYVITGAFDTLARQSGIFGDHVRYFTFGWSGLLSQQHRRIAGFNFYNALCNLRDQEGETPTIIIVGYSHGGNVALWFEQAEHEFKRNLEVNTLITLGCPMQVETVFATTSPVFKHIYAVRSDGDRVPQADRISTAAGKSSARLHDFINPAELNVLGSHHVCDIRVLVNGVVKSIDHRSFFNLCYKKKILPELSGLPFLMFIPHMLPMLYCHPEWSDVDLHLNVDIEHQALQLAWAGYERPTFEVLSPNIYAPFMQVRTIADHYWAIHTVKGGDELTTLDHMLLLPTVVTVHTENLIDRLRGKA